MSFLFWGWLLEEVCSPSDRDKDTTAIGSTQGVDEEKVDVAQRCHKSN
jgi:hypothetical protein